MERSNWSYSFQIREKHYGGENPVYIIAEIGANHNCNLEHAQKLVAECAAAGADAVKFQSWDAKKLQNIKELTTEGLLQDSPIIPILEKYEFPVNWHEPIVQYCRDRKIDFLSTPFDVDRARLLKSLYVPAIKIASGDITYHELLKEVGGYELPVFLSTGMANLGEIEQALTIIGHDSRRNIVLMHCVGAYPPQIEDGNILAVRTMQEAFGIPVGISDHFMTQETVLAAVALGASVVEKHVTLSRNDGAPDSAFALEIDQFSEMVQAIRRLERAMGSGKKQCMPSESGGLIGGRRSLFAAHDLKSGQVLCREDVAVVRPNIGELKPIELERILGCELNKDVACGKPLRWQDLQEGV